MFSKDKQRIVSFKGYLYVIFALLIWLQKAQKKKKENMCKRFLKTLLSTDPLFQTVCVRTHI